MAVSLLSNPVHALVEVLTLRKLVFLFVLLAPLLLIPLVAGSLWWTFAFGLAFTLLASNTMNFYPLSHHTVMLVPVFFAAVPAGMLRISRWVGAQGGDGARALRGLAVGVLVASVLATLRLGALVDNGSFKNWPHAVPYALEEAERARFEWVRGVARGLPPEATVAVSNLLGAHFSARDGVSLYPEVKDADYVVLHAKDVQPKGGVFNVRRVERRGYTVIDRHGDEIFVLRRDAPAGP